MFISNTTRGERDRHLESLFMWASSKNVLEEGLGQRSSLPHLGVYFRIDRFILKKNESHSTCVQHVCSAAFPYRSRTLSDRLHNRIIYHFLRTLPRVKLLQTASLVGESVDLIKVVNVFSVSCRVGCSASDFAPDQTRTEALSEAAASVGGTVEYL